MEQDLQVRDQARAVAVEWVVAADKEWVEDEVEWVVEDWVREEIVFALPAGQRYLINKELPVFN